MSNMAKFESKRRHRQKVCVSKKRRICWSNIVQGNDGRVGLTDIGLTVTLCRET